MDTLERLEKLKEKYDRLCVYVNSTITSKNTDEHKSLGRFLFSEHNLDGHYFQVIFGDPRDKSLLNVPADSLEEFYRWALKLNSAYVKRESRRRGFKPRRVW